MVAIAHHRQQVSRFLAFFQAAQTIYDVQSPALYRLAREVVENRRNYYILQEVRQLRRLWAQDRTRIDLPPWGAGSRAGLDRGQSSVRDLVRHMAVSPRAGRHLFHLARLYHPRHMLDLGTGVGFSAAYLAGGSLNGTCISVEGRAALSDLAGRGFRRLGLKNIQLVRSSFAKALADRKAAGTPLDLLHLDGDHSREAVERTWWLSRDLLRENSLFILSDIYWSAGMQSAWQWLKQQEEVSYSVDLFDLGVLFFNRGPLQQQHYRLVPARWKPWRTGLWPKLPDSD